MTAENLPHVIPPVPFPEHMRVLAMMSDVQATLTRQTTISAVLRAQVGDLSGSLAEMHADLLIERARVASLTSLVETLQQQLGQNAAP